MIALLLSVQIVVGANVQVSHDGDDVGHVEQRISASPNDPNFLAAAVTTFVPGQYRQDHVYVSHDRGSTWVGESFPYFPNSGSVDPDILITGHNTILFATGYRRNTDAHFRSTDGGLTWQRLPDSTAEWGMAVDATGGKFTNRVYRALLCLEKRDVSASYSTNDGQSFISAQPSCEHDSENIVVMPDGAVVLFGNGSYGKTGDLAAYAKASKDGGRTFGASHLVAHGFFISPAVTARRFPVTMAMPPEILSFMPCAADTSFGAHRNRLYCIWDRSDARNLTTHPYLTYSDDDGVTWSALRPVDPALAPWTTAALPMVAVDRRGTLGIAWLDTRKSKSRDRYDAWFVASSDGGHSFTRTVRLTTESSFPLNAQNLRPALFSPTNPESAGVAFTDSTYDYGRGNGGDYSKMVVDAAGDFHPIWPDARNGASQLFTADVRVVPDGEAATRPHNGLVSQDVTGKTLLILERSAFDASKNEETIWTRIKNNSKQTLYGPFTVSVSEMTINGQRIALLNASNGKRGDGATMIYRNTAGSVDVLPPNAITNPVAWRFKVPSATNSSLAFKPAITAFVKR